MPYLSPLSPLKTRNFAKYCESLRLLAREKAGVKSISSDYGSEGLRFESPRARTYC